MKTNLILCVVLFLLKSNKIAARRADKCHTNMTVHELN